MLKKSNNCNLDNLNVPQNCYMFYQVWQELVDSRTLDVYQYKIHNSLSLLKELDSVITKTISGLFTTDANIEACREETLYILNQDDILNKYNKALVNRLKFAIGKRPSSISDKNRLLYQIRCAIKTIEPTYLENVLLELKNSIEQEDSNNIIKYCNMIISQSVHNGWSTHALFDLLRFFTSEKTFQIKWNDFKDALVKQELIKHHVLINIPFRQQGTTEQGETLNALNKLGLDIKEYEEIVNIFTDISDIKTLINGEKKYFYITVDAKDIYSAAHLAITKISEQLNLASFYNLVSAWDLKSVVILSINSVSSFHRSFTAQELYETYDYIDSSGRIFENTRKIFVDESKMLIRDKLQGAFGYTNISRASIFQEEKYMNLWVALESLARTNMYSDIISSVKDTVPASTSLRYIYRIVRNFVEDCARCNVRFDFDAKNIDMNQETKQKLVSETIEIFNDTALFSELKEKCEVNSLLYHRIEEVYKILTDVDFAKVKIENHYKRVQWQIQRLYRIRNEIAHAALRENNSLLIYIEHLYDYLSTYISEIVCLMLEKDVNTLEETICIIKNNYEVFISFCDNNEQEIIKEKVLKTGIIDLI